MIKESLYILIFIFLTISCNSQESEKEIFYELFPEIVDKSYSDIRLRKEPPPPAPGTDSLIIKERRKNWKERRLKLLNDTTRTVILIPDSLYYDSFDFKENKKQFIDFFKNEELSLKNVDSKVLIHLDISKIKTNNIRVRFEYTSKYPKDKQNNYKYRPDREFHGILKVSRIRLDETSNYGYFILSYYRGPLNGWGTIIFIEKIHGKWKIKGSGSGWVS